MTLRISISQQAEAQLREHAEAAGQDPESYAAQILERSLRPLRTLEEISGPVGEAFLKSGMTEDELTEILEQAKHEVRAERRKA